MHSSARESAPRLTRLVSGAAGRKLAIVGFVHGDENSGDAILRLPDQIGRLRCGELTLIEAHPHARRRNVRFIDEDLNRDFVDHPRPTAASLEADIATRMKSIVRDNDALIDLHATSQASPPFAVSFGDAPMARSLASYLGIVLVTGFNDHLGGTLLGWATDQGLTALAIECGAKGEEETADVATYLALKALAFFGMIEKPPDPPNAATLRASRYNHLHVRESATVADPETFTYCMEPAVFVPLPPATLVGEDCKNRYFSPAFPSFLIMPASMEAIRSYKGPSFFFAEAQDSAAHLEE